MFAELPNLFDRDFAIGYLLPCGAFLAANLGLVTAFHTARELTSALETNLLTGTTIAGLLAWLLAVTLLAVNYSIIRFLEGYGAYNPLQLLRGIEHKRYDDLQKRISELDAEYTRCAAEQKTLPPDKRKARADKLKELADHFPADERWLLPTAFGNTIRAFETYSWAMYGMDTIVGWNRLLAVIPKDYRDIIDEAKAVTDFWVNLWALAGVVVVEYAALALWNRSNFAADTLWFPACALAVIVFASGQAKQAAVAWGDVVKSSVDTYLPALRAQLQLPAETDPDKARKVWEAFSQAANYRDPSPLHP